MIVFGFTGSRHGLTVKQENKLDYIINSLLDKGVEISVAHHGGCVGADYKFATIMIENGIKTVRHPASDVDSRFIADDLDEVVLAARPALTRNRDIVKFSDFVLACPNSNTEVVRSGTWSTIRYCKRIKKNHCIIFPNGTHLHRPG